MCVGDLWAEVYEDNQAWALNQVRQYTVETDIGLQGVRMPGDGSCAYASLLASVDPTFLVAPPRERAMRVQAARQAINAHGRTLPIATPIGVRTRADKPIVC
jgi:hypothetical protein